MSKTKSILLASLFLLIGTLSALAQPANQDPDKALALLKEGNGRYVAGKTSELKRSRDRPQELNSSQAPYAAIISCADSRVDPLLAFDTTWGDLFITRVAGNLAEPYVIGSNEYAYAVLGTRLIVVLGHEGCGAVAAALGESTPEGPLGKVVEYIRPATKGMKPDQLKAATEANVRKAMADLQEQSPMLRQAVADKKVKILGAVYMLETGEVRFLP